MTLCMWQFIVCYNVTLIVFYVALIDATFVANAMALQCIPLEVNYTKRSCWIFHQWQQWRTRVYIGTYSKYFWSMLAIKFLICKLLHIENYFIIRFNNFNIFIHKRILSLTFAAIKLVTKRLQGMHFWPLRHRDIVIDILYLLLIFYLSYKNFISVLMNTTLLLSEMYTQWNYVGTKSVLSWRY